MSSRIQWQFETPSYTFQDPFQLKKLQSAELWVDRLVSTVNFYVYYRPGSSSCFYFWAAWKECATKDCTEDIPPLNCPVRDYPEQPYCPQYRATMVLPEPPSFCEPNNARPSVIDYQFQLKIAVRGSCRVRGLLVHATEVMSPNFEGIIQC